MKSLILFFMLTLVVAAPLDGICDRDQGESCMNNPDCTYCNITSSVNVSYFDTYALISVTVKNWEPAEVPLILSVRKDSKDFTSKQLDITDNAKEVVEVKMEREVDNSTVIVEIRDRDIGTAWSYQTFILPGLERKGKTDLWTPILGVFLFLGIIFFGFKQVTKPRQKMITPPPVLVKAPEPQGEEVVVVSKKKKYYYKKN